MRATPCTATQQALVDRGYTVDVDGYFGPATEQTVYDFQLIEGLEVDGLVGPNTWSTLVGGPGWDLDGNGIIDPDEVVYDERPASHEPPDCHYGGQQPNRNTSESWVASESADELTSI